VEKYGLTVTVKVADPSFPAVSLTVAVHTDVKVTVVSGAVNAAALSENDPPFVQEILGLEATPTLSEYSKTVLRVPVETVVRSLFVKFNEGASVSDAGGGVGGGGAGGGVFPFPPPSPPQEAIANPPKVMTVFLNRSLMSIFFSYIFLYWYKPNLILSNPLQK
jgi:hypothetical protein